jgi:DNA-binding MarR family transcriptional regulator
MPRDSDVHVHFLQDQPERQIVTTTPYFESIQLIERLHRYFLDVVKVELDRKSIQDINNVQAMILYNIGHDDMTVGELTLRGYYLGSNVSYNVKKMSENGYIEQERSVHDKRSIRVKLSSKGKDLYKMLEDMFIRHETKLKGGELSPERMTEVNKTLKMFERFWTSQSQFTGLASLDDED